MVSVPWTTPQKAYYGSNGGAGGSSSRVFETPAAHGPYGTTPGRGGGTTPTPNHGVFQTAKEPREPISGRGSQRGSEVMNSQRSVHETPRPDGKEDRTNGRSKSTNHSKQKQTNNNTISTRTGPHVEQTPSLPRKLEFDTTPRHHHQNPRPADISGDPSKLHVNPRYDLFGHQRKPKREGGQFAKNLEREKKTAEEHFGYQGNQGGLSSTTLKQGEVVPGPNQPYDVHGLSQNDRRGRTKTQMDNEHYLSRLPSLSYDLDGDGVVGERDYFVARYFDVDKSGVLDAKQKARAEKALKEGFLDKFKFGLAGSGTSNPSLVLTQKAGRIITVNTMDDVDTYPPRYGPNPPVPKHRTKTEVLEDRKAEMRNAGYQYYENFRAKNPLLVREPVEDYLPDHHKDRWAQSLPPRLRSINDRAEADHQEARVRAGLLPMGMALNPEKEDPEKAPGLRWIENPEISCASELKAARKDALRAELEQQRRHGEEHNLTPRVRKSIYEANCTEMRKGHQPGVIKKTKTTLREDRRRERVEYDRTYFGEQEKQYPRYSDRDQGWWTYDRDYKGEKARSDAILEMGDRLPGLAPYRPNEAQLPDMANYTPELDAVLNAVVRGPQQGQHGQGNGGSGHGEGGGGGERRGDATEGLLKDKGGKRLSHPFSKTVANQDEPRLFDKIVSDARQDMRPNRSFDFSPTKSSMQIINKQASETQRKRFEMEKQNSPYDDGSPVSRLSPLHKSNRSPGRNGGMNMNMNGTVPGSKSISHTYSGADGSLVRSASSGSTIYHKKDNSNSGGHGSHSHTHSGSGHASGNVSGHGSLTVAPGNNHAAAVQAGHHNAGREFARINNDLHYHANYGIDPSMRDTRGNVGGHSWGGNYGVNRGRRDTTGNTGTHTMMNSLSNTSLSHQTPTRVSSKPAPPMVQRQASAPRMLTKLGVDSLNSPSHNNKEGGGSKSKSMNNMNKGAAVGMAMGGGSATKGVGNYADKNVSRSASKNAMNNMNGRKGSMGAVGTTEVVNKPGIRTAGFVDGMLS